MKGTKPPLSPLRGSTLGDWRKRELAAQEEWEDMALCCAVAILALCALAACVWAVLS